jgi:hypothetical protein
VTKSADDDLFKKTNKNKQKYTKNHQSHTAKKRNNYGYTVLLRFWLAQRYVDISSTEGCCPQLSTVFHMIVLLD